MDWLALLKGPGVGWLWAGHVLQRFWTKLSNFVMQVPLLLECETCWGNERR